jgi:signal transduction histidine kinase
MIPVMNVAAVSGYQQAQLAAKVQYAVARKTLDAQEANGSAMVQLIQSAGQVGQNTAQRSTGPGDALVAQALGLGGQIDVVA